MKFALINHSKKEQGLRRSLRNLLSFSLNGAVYLTADFGLIDLYGRVFGFGLNLALTLDLLDQNFSVEVTLECPFGSRRVALFLCWRKRDETED